ncbi:MAG: hypothetical protein ACKVS8_00785 [Phycisphaerales bacterium]
MPLIIAGIDEAGYGPLLGPLCVGMCALEIADWSPGDTAPDVWALLSACVCRKAGDKRRRIAVEDSKKLKLANSSTTRHPLTHLERGVLAFLAAQRGEALRTDADLYAALGASVEDQPWYAGEPIDLPLGTTAEELAIAANTLASGLATAGVRPVRLACRVVAEREYNALVRQWGTKAATTGLALREHLRFAWANWSGRAGSDASEDGCVLRVVCDRQGGRTAYAESLARWVPGAEVVVQDESPARSRYLVRSTSGQDAGREMVVVFQPEAESACLPVALASMAAKLTRELLMARFNRHFAARLPELKPTAGYRQDAARWLHDAASVVSRSEREEMVRIA